MYPVCDDYFDGKEECKKKKKILIFSMLIVVNEIISYLSVRC